MSRWKEIREEFNGYIRFNDEYKIEMKWYRFSFIATRKYLEDYGEGVINAGFPSRFKRGWHEFDIDAWRWYIIPFHIIIPFFKLIRIWFYWKIVIKINEKHEMFNLTVKEIKRIRGDAYQDGFEDARRWLAIKSKEYK